MHRIARIPSFLYEGENEGGAAAPAAVAEPPAAAPQEPPEKTVPLSEVQKERKARQDLEKRLKRFEEDAETRRQAELTESERLKEQLAQAEARAADADRRADSAQRTRWVVDAAVDEGFKKPGVVARLIDNLDSLETAEDAALAVKDAARDYPELLRSKTSPDPSLQEVLRDGERPKDKPNPDDEKLLTKQQLDALTPEQINEMDEKQPGRIEKSYAALLNT
jgi:hypothetical protein